MVTCGPRRRVPCCSQSFWTWLLVTACLAAPLHAQDKPRTIGYLSTGPGATTSTNSLLQGLRELGWIENRNIRIEWRWADNRPERLLELAQDLVRLKVDLIVASGTPAVAAAKAATSTLPIVMGSAADAEASGFVDSLARPGRNLTGVSMMMPALAGKRLELLKELHPGLQRVAYLAYAPDPAHKLFLKQTQEAGQALKVRVQQVLVQSTAELSAAFAAMKKEQAEALIVQPLFINNLGLGPQLAELAAANRLPSISDGAGYAEAGGLIYYGPDPAATYARVAGYVDRILKGARPAEMPVEQPQKFQLIINQVTARRLGVRLPQALTVRADRVIE